MASIITATTTSGLTQSADNSGVLQLASGTGNLVTIPSVTGTAMVSGNMPAFYVYNNADQSLTTSTETKITLDVEVFDTNNNFASSRFTPTVAGYYQLNYGIRLGGTSMTSFYMLIFKNGTYYSVNSQANFPSGNLTQELIFGGSNIVYCNGSTDYVELYISLAATSPKVIGGRPTTGTYFSGCLIRGA